MADLDAGVASYEKLGLECTQRMSNEDLGIHQAILPLADGNFIELVSPISDDSPVGKALARDGEGMHTIAFRATPLDEACEVIKASGATLIGEGGPQVFVRACRPLSALCSALLCSALLLLLTPAPATAAVCALGLLLRLLRSSATYRTVLLLTPPACADPKNTHGILLQLGDTKAPKIHEGETWESVVEVQRNEEQEEGFRSKL